MEVRAEYSLPRFNKYIEAIKPNTPPNIHKFMSKKSYEDWLSVLSTNWETGLSEKNVESYMNGCLKKFILSDNPVTQVLSAYRLAWILNKTGKIDDRQREEDLFFMYTNWLPHRRLMQQTYLPTVREVLELVRSKVH